MEDAILTNDLVNSVHKILYNYLTLNLSRRMAAMDAKTSNSLAGSGTSDAPTAALGSGTMLGQLLAAWGKVEMLN